MESCIIHDRVAGYDRPRVIDELQVYGQIGEEGFARLIRAFYAQVVTDDILAPMYPSADMAGAEARLRDFLVGRFGGPMRYVEQRGHPRLRRRHVGFRIDRLARDRWVALMTRALDETGLPAESDAVLRGFFDATATFMINTEAAPMRAVGTDGEASQT